MSEEQKINVLKLVENIATISVSLNETQTKLSNFQQELMNLRIGITKLDQVAHQRFTKLEESLTRLSESVSSIQSFGTAAVPGEVELPIPAI